MATSDPGSSLDRTTPGGVEIERKFLVDVVPADLASHPSERIAQGYLSLDPVGAEVRLRRRGYHTLLTVKSGRGLQRTEEEFLIDGPRFDRLWPATENRRVEKTRYKLPLEGGLTLELDVFEGALDGLVMAEVEFSSLEAAQDFRPPEWLRPEVTDDRRYANARLAIHGIPDRQTVGVHGLLDGEPPATGLVFVVLSQINTAATALEDASADERAKAIHTSRKAFKRGRALIRVARSGLPAEVVERDNVALREAGRLLSGTRDAEVLVQTLDKLVERDHSGIEPAQVAGLRAQLVIERDEQNDRAKSDKGAIGEVLSLLDRARADVAEWELAGDPAEVLADGLERILHKGRKALRVVHELGDGPERTEASHDLRKRAKDLWHAAELLEIAAPHELRGLQAAAHTLADHLGDDHDLAVLEEQLAARPGVLSDDDARALRKAIGKRHRKLERKALALADEVFGTRHRGLTRAVRRLGAR